MTTRWYRDRRCVCACPERWGDGAPLRVLREGAAPTLRREDGAPGEHVCPSPRALARDKERATETVLYRVTPSQLELLRTAAGKVGVAKWARRVALEAAEAERTGISAATLAAEGVQPGELPSWQERVFDEIAVSEALRGRDGE